MRPKVLALALWALCGCGTTRTLYVIDQIDEGRAVLIAEDGTLVTTAAADLPPGAQEGEVLVDGRRDDAERARLQAEIDELRSRLSQGDDGRDLTLGEGP